jgi:hypothetical protein
MDLFRPDHPLMEDFQEDLLPVLLFIGFYLPTFQIGPV